MKRTGKRSIIACIIALSLVLTGIGYAYWTDTLNVTTKATTGDLDITFVDLGLYAQYDDDFENVTNSWSIIDGIGNGYVEQNAFARGMNNFNIVAKDGSIQAYYDRAKGYNKIEFDAKLVNPGTINTQWGPYGANTKNSDEIELSIFNMYPGYAQAFRTDIINLGSIAAKLSTIDFNIGTFGQKTLSDATKGLMGVALYICVDNDPGQVFKLCTTFANGNNFFTLGGVDFLRFSALESIDNATLRAAITNAQMECKTPDREERMDLFIAIGMDPDAEGIYTSGSTALNNYEARQWIDGASQDNGVTLSVKLGWDQFNVGVPAQVNGNILKEQNK